MRRLLKSMSLFVAVTLCSASVAFAAAPNAVAVKVQKQYQGITSLFTEFTQELVHKESGGKEERKGSLSFQKPLLVRWETTSPTRELLIVTSKEIWNVFPEENKAYKYPPDLANDSKSIVRVVTGQSKLTEDFTIEQKKHSSKEEPSLVELKLFPKEPSQSMVELDLWVHSATGMIVRLRILDFYGNENTISFSNLQRNAKVASDSFVYKPAAKVKVEDRTKDGIVEKPLMQ